MPYGSSLAASPRPPYRPIEEGTSGRLPVRQRGMLMLFLCLLVLGVPAPHVRAEAPPPERTALVGGTLIFPERTGPDGVVSEHIILLAGDRIERILPESEGIPAGARVVDVTGKYILPGLIDSHVHFFQSGNPYTRPDILDLTHRVPYRAEVERNMERLDTTLRVWLASGVIGVADLGGPWWNLEVRERARELPLAPRVAVAGPLISTVDRPELEVLGMDPIRQVDTPEEAARVAREQLTRQPDFLKVWFIHRPGDDLSAQTRLVEAVGQVAHEAGLPLVVHATELETAKAALRAGADILAHSVSDQPVDEEFLALARRNQVIYIPTLFVQRGYALALSGEWEPTEAERRLADPQVLEMMEGLPERRPARPAERSAVAMDNLRRVWEAGIMVAAGSDAGNIGTLHGPGFFRELKLMEQAGLSPHEVLRSATVHGAKVLGLEDTVGRLAPGFAADLLILEANPLERIDNIRRVYRVVRGGRVVDPDALVP